MRARTSFAVAAISFIAFASMTAHSQAGDAGESSAEGLEEIVVTARRREETLQQVPLAITALGPALLQRLQVENLADLRFRVPNLGITATQATPTSAQIYLRGVGQDEATPTFEPATSLYVDGVYMARLQGSLLDVGEFERVEVLRGPQGTLYGRNSSAGAISFISRRPSLTESRYTAEFTIGEFNRRDLRGSVEMPLVEGRLGARLEFLSRDRDGYVTRRGDGSDTSRIDRDVARLLARWAPSDSVTVDLSADIARDRSGAQEPIPLTDGSSLPGGRQPQYGYYITDADVPDLNEFDGGGASIVVTWDLGAAEFKSISAWRRFGNIFWGDLRGRSLASGLRSAILRDLNQKQLTQEIQLTSTGNGRLDWVVGAFYLREDLRNRDTLLRFHAYDLETSSAAVFSDLTYALTDRLSITAGGRYTRDEKTYDGLAIALSGREFTSQASPSFSRFTPKVGVSYQWDGGPLVYAAWQKGFKAGAVPGFPQNPLDVSQGVLPPEDVKSLEAGLKADWFGGRLRTNVAFFDSDWTDLQVNVRNLATGVLESRSADAKARGFEIELDARPVESLSLRAALGKLDGEYTRAGVGVTPATICIDCGHLKHAPDLQWNVGFEWTHGVSGGNVKIGANYVRSDQVYFSAAIVDRNSQATLGLLDASVRFESDRGWYVAAGLQNSTDEQWATTGTDGAGVSLWVQPPRLWSLSFGYRQP